MSRWEYQVIHLNVEDSSKANQGPGHAPAEGPQQPAPGAPQSPPLAGQPVFSKAYLEQEFPDFYSNPPAQPPQQPPQPQQQPNHPALQLQQFLNGHGQQGWSLVGIYPLGSLLMMFFRRRIPEPPAPPMPEPAPLVQQAPPAPAPAAPIPPPAPLSAPEGATAAAPGMADAAPPPVMDWLQQIMQRLESLEGRIASPAASQPAPNPVPAKAVAPPAPVETVPQRSVVPGERRLRRRSSAAQPPKASPSVGTPASAADPASVAAAGAPGEAVILSSSLLASLDNEVGIPTFHAAKALEFRSYATLAGYGSRHGYPLGLVKEGANQMAAVYVGLEQGDRGGRAKRLWVVVPRDRLLPGLG